MIKIIYTLIFSLLIFKSFSQISNNINDCFTYLSIKNSIQEYQIDSIRFIISGDLSKKKPIILFIQGSGTQSIIQHTDSAIFPITVSCIPKQFYHKYHIVLISKPYISIKQAYQKSNNIINYEKFLTLDNLDYYVQTSKLVLSFIKNKSFCDSTKIFVIGHSQGYSVAAKLSALYPHLISKTVCMSSNVFDRQSGVIRDIRLKEKTNIINHDIAQQKIDSIYNNYKKIKIGKQTKINSFSDTLNFYRYKRDYSFNFDPPINYLLKINTPILVVYGTNDKASYDNDLLPLFFTRSNKNNLSMLVYPNYDHNYFETIYDNSKAKKIPHWFDVFNDVEIWLESGILKQ